MASLWPRPVSPINAQYPKSAARSPGGFDREGDKMYLAAEVLRGQYGKEADIFRYVLRCLNFVCEGSTDSFLALAWSCWRLQRILWFPLSECSALVLLAITYFGYNLGATCGIEFATKTFQPSVISRTAVVNNLWLLSRA